MPEAVDSDRNHPKNLRVPHCLARASLLSSTSPIVSPRQSGRPRPALPWKLLQGGEPDGGTGPRAWVVPGQPIGRASTSSAHARADARVVMGSLRAGPAGAVVCENQSSSPRQEGRPRSRAGGGPESRRRMRTAGVIPVREVVETRSVSHRQMVRGTDEEAGLAASRALPPRDPGRLARRCPRVDTASAPERGRGTRPRRPPSPSGGSDGRSTSAESIHADVKHHTEKTTKNPRKTARFSPEPSN
jgi:hypothetical protein